MEIIQCSRLSAQSKSLISKLISRLISVVYCCVFFNYAAQAEAEEQDYFSISLEQLASIKVVTSSKREQTIAESYANVTVITKELIERRGYRNIIEILEDLPGFDFATYEDGGGEYPVHNLNRGIGGDNGNTRLMVMVDGLVQNHISFNWAQGLTDEQMLIDVERIEVVQGPGSALYGAQAVSGIVHIITRQKFEGLNTKVLLGENNTRSFELMYGNSIGEVNYQLAIKQYLSDGDGGIGRYDPGGYFNNNVYPAILTADYDESGNFLTNVANPLAGQSIADGFNNSKDDRAIRFKLTTDNLEMGLHHWEKQDGLGSYVVPYEYQATNENFQTHHSGSTLYLKNSKDLVKDKVIWNTDFWYREDRQESDTGFSYTYRFPELVKSYHSASSQIGIENHFDWQLADSKVFILGFRLLNNRQTEQVVSLGQYQNGNASTTQSSWDIAAAGGGLGQEKVNEVIDESEFAVYALLEGKFTDRLSYSIGERYSNGSDYGSTNTPRLGLIYQAESDWLYKLLYGSAYRQPSIFELHDEFRGQTALRPESIDTVEFEVSRRLNASNLKFNLFFSKLTDSIDLVPDASRAGGESYANVDSSQVRGVSSQWEMNPVDELNFYLNYIYQQGKNDLQGWGALAHTAKHKLNAGVNWQPADSNINIDLRANYVGTRVVPASNQYFNGEAPGYTKLDFVLSWRNLFNQPNLMTQFIVNNLLDEDYYGVGRQSGSSLRSDYDPLTNPNPPGFIPAYHPQAGRTIFWNISYRL